ncbi:hypothetical protein MNBD_BACTEROID07-549, partial [hydrothermal vent metagenome]
MLFGTFFLRKNERKMKIAMQ